MSNTVIQLKRSGTSSNQPSSLEYGELAINYADGKLYYKNTSDVIVEYTPDLGYFGTVNVDGTLLVASINDSVLRMLEGNNIVLSANSSNDSLSISADLSSAWSYANTKISSLLQDTSPKLAANLDSRGFSITNTQSIHINGGGSAGSWTPFAGRETLIIENDGDVGITFATPDSATAAFVFAVASDDHAGSFRFDYPNQLYQFQTSMANGSIEFNTGNQVVALRIDAQQKASFRGNVAVEGAELTIGGINYNTTAVAAYEQANSATTTAAAAFNAANVFSELSEDTTPQLGGSLDGQGYDISNINNLYVANTIITYNTNDTTGNAEFGLLDWAGNQLIIGASRSGTGSFRNMVFQTSNTARWKVTASGHFTAGTDNSYDIGEPTDNRPRNIHAANNITTTTLFVNGVPHDTTAAAAFDAANTASGGISNVVEDTTPELGGNLDGQGYNISNVNTFSAVTKSFDIVHPLNNEKRLVHGSLEGPEHGVYVRGTTTNYIIKLPDYWKKLVDWNTVTVQLTPRQRYQQLYVSYVDQWNCHVHVADTPEFPLSEYDYFIQAERVDTEKLIVEK